MLRVTGSSSGMMLWCVISAVRDVCTFRKPWKYRQVGQESMDIILLAFFTGRWKPWKQFADVDIKYIVAVILAQMVKQTLLLVSAI